MYGKEILVGSYLKKTYKCTQVEGNYEILQDRLDNLVDVFIGSKLHHFYTLKRTKFELLNMENLRRKYDSAYYGRKS